MKPLLITHGDYLKHDTGPSHPERRARLEAIMAQLEKSGVVKGVQRVEDFERAPVGELSPVHDADYVKRVEKACAEKKRIMDSPDTPICGLSYDIARRATGGVLHGLDAVMGGKAKRAFCVSRPPGHHAEKAQAMGFCLFNHIAVGADYLTRKHGVKRVGIVDFDVHHGNGTQHAFDERSDVLFISMHEHPRFQYPGTGYEREVGIGEGEGYTLNVPLLPETDDDGFLKAFYEKVLPKLREYKPEVLMVSAGFDASKEDPLGHLELTPKAYHEVTRELVGVAKETAQGRVVSVLEGGYNLEALARDVQTHLEALIED